MHRKDAGNSKPRIIFFDTEEKRLEGLRGVSHLPWSTIAIFTKIFAGRFFNTIGCLIPLDIAAMSDSGEVLKCWTVPPGVPAIGPMPVGTTMVLEANAGWIKANYGKSC